MVPVCNYLTKVSFPSSMARLGSESLGRTKSWGKRVTAVRNQDKDQDKER
jgi:hypothetical protein